MKKTIFILFIFLILVPAPRITAQNLTANEPTTVTFDTTGFPQWAKDLRRFDIIAFGTFPFTMFAVTFTTDMVRWSNANSYDWSEEGRRYAPWPLKSAGAVEMTNDELVRTVSIAAGASLTLALVDLIIVKIKRNKEQRRIESLPSGIYEIEITPYGTPEEDNT
ncbi:MAG: hypothetical protein FWD14_06800 [Treponema sp.]|nr:hypothetical protein [Treponema sp.]